MPDRADDACDLLDADHLAVKHLFVEYARLAYAAADTTSGASQAQTVASADDARSAIAAAICDALTVHAQIEEEIFYPALREAVPEAAALLDAAEQEHGEAKDLIAQIRPLQAADSSMDQLVADLANAIEEHVKEERDALFPKARAAVALDLMDLGARLRQRQQALEQQTPMA